MRWQHPDHGLLGPGEFIPLAERTGLIHPLTRWVLDAALRQAAHWHQDGHRLSVAVNVSTRCLLDLCFPDQVAERLDAWEVPPGSLVLEVTESAVMADPARALDVLGRPHALGVRLAVDDFGTGHSSMAYLQGPAGGRAQGRPQLRRPDGRQLKRRGDRPLHHRPRPQPGPGRGRRGVESEEACRKLEALGCDTAQGYYLGRPMPAAALEHWLERPAGLSPAIRGSRRRPPSSGPAGRRR